MIRPFRYTVELWNSALSTRLSWFLAIENKHNKTKATEKKDIAYSKSYLSTGLLPQLTNVNRW